MSIERRSSQDIPAWYNLETNGDQFCVSVHKEAISGSDDYYQRVLRLFADLNLPDTFTPPTADKEWGFGQIIQEYQHPELADWLVYKCKIPSLEKKDSLWPIILETTATLALIFRQLSRIKTPTDSKFPQLMEVNLEVNLNGEHPISAEVRPAFLKWVNFHIGRGSETEVAQVMLENYKRMCGSKDVFDYHFQVQMKHPYDIYLQCPGNACGLFPAGRYRSDKLEAYEMTSHNVDTPFQQITLLVGIAKFNQLAMDDYVIK